MKILALDSSGMVASVAIAEDDRLLAEYTVNYKKTHSQTLLPMLQEAAKMIELDLNTVDAIAVAGGPGSFTGLRIGSATAKGLGLALNKPLIHVPTLEGMAFNLWGTDKVVCPMMDARRAQVYTGIYEFCESERKDCCKNRDCGAEGCGSAQKIPAAQKLEFHVLEDQMAVPVTEVIGKLNALGREVVLLGDGVPVYREQLEAGLKVPYHFVPAHLNQQRASSLAACAMEYAKQGKMETAAEHQPDYLRVSQAERERAERLNAQEN